MMKKHEFAAKMAIKHLTKNNSNSNGQLADIKKFGIIVTCFLFNPISFGVPFIFWLFLSLFCVLFWFLLRFLMFSFCFSDVFLIFHMFLCFCFFSEFFFLWFSVFLFCFAFLRFFWFLCLFFLILMVLLMFLMFSDFCFAFFSLPDFLISRLFVLIFDISWRAWFSFVFSSICCFCYFSDCSMFLLFCVFCFLLDFWVFLFFRMCSDCVWCLMI